MVNPYTVVKRIYSSHHWKKLNSRTHTALGKKRTKIALLWNNVDRIIIDLEALAKQGDNGPGSVCTSVNRCALSWRNL